MNIDKLTKVLNDTSQTIKQATETVQKNPLNAKSFFPKIMDHLKDINSFGDLSNISATVTDDQKDGLIKAISAFLKNTKDAQEKVGALGASIFGNPQVVSVTANLEQVKDQLKRGKRVERSEEGGGI